MDGAKVCLNIKELITQEDKECVKDRRLSRREWENVLQGCDVDDPE